MNSQTNKLAISGYYFKIFFLFILNDKLDVTDVMLEYFFNQIDHKTNASKQDVCHHCEQFFLQ